MVTLDADQLFSFKKVLLFMRYTVDFLLAILLTSLSYLIGGILLKTDLAVFQALIIGISVVSLGAITEALKAPLWLIILVPFPVGMFLLLLFLQESLQIWFLTYLVTLAIYTVIHVIMSYALNFIP